MNARVSISILRGQASNVCPGSIHSPWERRGASLLELTKSAFAGLLAGWPPCAPRENDQRAAPLKSSARP
jgi:hypothetical protein